jgi:hypothetical protein
MTLVPLAPAFRAVRQLARRTLSWSVLPRSHVGVDRANLWEPKFPKGTRRRIGRSAFGRHRLGLPAEPPCVTSSPCLRIDTAQPSAQPLRIVPHDASGKLSGIALQLLYYIHRGQYKRGCD